MRATTITVRGGQVLEVFARPRDGSGGEFEVWMVGTIRGQRTVLNHLLTHEDYEKRLCYAQADDLVWRGTSEEAIPCVQTDVARANDEAFQRGAFWDDASLCCYNASHQLPVDRKATNRVRKSLVGRWTDGAAVLEFDPDERVRFSLPALSVPIAFAPLRFLYAAAQHDHADRWSFSGWWLFLMDQAQMRGHKIGMWHCDEHELHLFTARQNVLVHVFNRA